VHRPAALVACALGLVAAGCGDAKPAAPPRAAVHVALTAPGDGAAVRNDTVVLRGTVRPAGATVLVHGRRVEVAGGAFETTVGLEAGTNVIDVLASAPDARPAMSALRVRRLVTVRVPDVTGDSPAQAKERLAGFGLRAQVDDVGGLFDSLLPGDPVVCSVRPAAGTVVDAGSTVRILTAKGC